MFGQQYENEINQILLFEKCYNQMYYKFVWR